MFLGVVSCFLFVGRLGSSFGVLAVFCWLIRSWFLRGRRRLLWFSCYVLGYVVLQLMCGALFLLGMGAIGFEVDEKGLLLMYKNIGAYTGVRSYDD